MSIDYRNLLENPKFRARVPAERLAEYLADEDDEKIAMECSAEGNQVLTLGWDGGFPGCSGVIYVTEWHGFYFFGSSDYDPEGPFDSLDDALSLEYFSTTTACPTLDSETIPLEDLKAIGLGILAEDDDDGIWINGTKYELQDGELEHWEEIVSDDDGEGPAEFLAWSGFERVWEDEELGEEGGTPQEFLELAEKNSEHIRVSSENWGGDSPGISGTSHQIETNDATALKEDLKRMVETIRLKKNPSSDT